MHCVVDTCGWIEWLTDGAVADRFAPCLQQVDQVIVPTVIQFELYKWVKREQGEARALEVAALTEQGVQAMTVGDFTAGFRAECPGEVGVYVRRADLSAAQSALASAQQTAAEIDWSQVDWRRASDEDARSE